jgi:hypothetical protein
LATNAKFCSIDVVCPPSLAQSFARKDQRNLAALTLLAALTRAREAGADFQQALTPTDLHRPAGRCCGCWPTSTFSFWRNCCWRILGADAGARAIGVDADVAFAWSGRRR